MFVLSVPSSLGGGRTLQKDVRGDIVYLMSASARFVFGLLSILALLLVVSSAASVVPSAFLHALNDYNAGRYDDAIAGFARFAQMDSSGTWVTACRFMQAKSLYMANRWAEADSQFQRFIVEFPCSNYLAAVWLYRGHIAYLTGDLLSSANFYMEALTADSTSAAAQAAMRNIEPLLEDELTADELSALRSKWPNSRLSGDILLAEVGRRIKNGDITRAQTLLNQYVHFSGATDRREEVARLRNQIRHLAGNVVRIGVLAPLSGPYTEYGAELVAGIEDASAERQEINGRRIELMIKDTGGLPVQTAIATNELLAENPVAVIGPLRSETAAVAAGILSQTTIPMITPTASEPGITLIGGNIYQLTPPAETMARALAQYVVGELGVKQVAIISSDDMASHRTVGAFEQAVYDFGGEVIATAFYRMGTTDFSAQIELVRAPLIVKTEEEIASGLVDSADYYDTVKQRWLDRKNWRVQLGALFLLGSCDDLVMLIPQIRYHLIETCLIGLYSWDSPEFAERLTGYLDGAIFVTDSPVSGQGRLWPEFERRFVARHGRRPGRIAALGYDAFLLVAAALAKGHFTADAVNQFLAETGQFDAASGTIDLKSRARCNNSLGVYKIAEGRCLRLR